MLTINRDFTIDISDHSYKNNFAALTILLMIKI